MNNLDLELKNRRALQLPVIELQRYCGVMLSFR